MGTGLIRLGTSAFTAAGWPGGFYPANLKSADYLTYYATQFDTVEVDSTFHRAPSVSTVRGWYAKTPPGFLFAAKLPQAITHEKVLVDCDAEVSAFLAAMDLLGEKLGPLLLQFPWFPDTVFLELDDFLARLRPFLDRLPKRYRFAVEIRNKAWLVPKLADALREQGVALALIDQSWMPRIAEWFEHFDPITADFTYIRWLGDRKGIERLTKTWSKTIRDRREPLQEWVKVCDQAVRRSLNVFAFANNHYAGHGPATVRLAAERNRVSP
jgi:uncharacterized protein YecE (DUF72 family)